MEKNGVELKNILQLSKKDFDEKELKIKNSFSILPKEKFLGNNIDIKIFEYSSKFNQLLGLVKKLSDEKEQCQIYALNYILYFIFLQSSNKIPFDTVVTNFI